MVIKHKFVYLLQLSAVLRLMILLNLISLCGVITAADKKEKQKAFRPVPIKIQAFYEPNKPEQSDTQRLIRLMREYPEMKVEKWGGIMLPGGGSKAALMMSIAGDSAPDLGLSWFHIVRNEIKQGFLYPLNEWIGEDTNGNGQIDDDEAIWEGWKDIKPLWRRVCTINGKVYGIPWAKSTDVAIIYRVDMVAAAGLNPNKPPATWDEFLYWCQKLTDPNKKIPGAIVEQGQKAIAIPAAGHLWLPWIQSQGGAPIIQIKKSPKTGKEYSFPSGATSFMTPDGENLNNVKPLWRANFASEEGVKATEWIHKLRWLKWMINPKSKEPVSLTQEDIENHFIMQDGEKLEFTDEEIITGVGRPAYGPRGGTPNDLLGRGEVAMMLSTINDLTAIGSRSGVDPALLSWMPYPAVAGKKGNKVLQMQNHYIVMYEGVKNRPKRERDYIWKAAIALNDEENRNLDITDKVLSGLSRFVNPKDLKRLGYEEYIRDIPRTMRQNFTDIENGKIKTYTEPWSGFWFTMDMAISAEVLGIILGSNGEDFDYKTALKYVQNKANSGVMFATSEKELQEARPMARIIFTIILAMIVFFVVLIIRNQLKKSKNSTAGVYSGWFAWLLVCPALLLIGVWGYYPLVRGMVMAFQDYKITGDTTFVGLDNFIILAKDSGFWMSLVRTVYFVFLNMLFAFCAPIILAILLTEVTRFKIFFRTLFFLPQMTSGLVIALMWKLMYTPTPQGFFNQLLSILNYIPFVQIEPQTWLDDPKLAMICCVIPTVWASMGMASLIYLAALHSVPPDFYEAAEVDGAGVWSKLKHITFPTLLPLIIINFVGAFIGTFQNMGNIFLMTFGGPGEATTVIGLKIWIEAYNNLRFSMACSMAWVLGSLLIGFTYLQIQFLGKVEYRKAKE